MKNKRTKVLYIIFFIAAVFFAAFILAEFRKDYVAVALAAILMLIAAYFLVDKIEHDIYERYDADQKDINEKLGETVQVVTRGSKKIDQLQEAIINASLQGLSQPFEKLDELSGDFHEVEKKLDGQKLQSLDLNLTDEILKEQRILAENQRELVQLVKTGFKTLIQYSKENARQVALNTNENTEKLLAELDTSMNQLLEKLQSIVTTDPIHEQMKDVSAELLQNTLIVNQSLEQIQVITDQLSKALHE